MKLFESSIDSKSPREVLIESNNCVAVRDRVLHLTSTRKDGGGAEGCSPVIAFNLAVMSVSLDPDMSRSSRNRSCLTADAIVSSR